MRAAPPSLDFFSPTLEKTPREEIPALLPIESARYQPLRQYWAAAKLQNKIAPALSAEFASLSAERDPELFEAELRNLALKLDGEGQEFASVLFSCLGESRPGYRAEVLLRNFTREICNPATILSMSLGGAAFQSLRFGTLSRLLASPSAGFWTRGFGAEAVASTLGFIAEVPTFTFTHRWLRSLSYAPNSTSNDWEKELLGNGLFLGALKITGALGQQLGKRISFELLPTTANFSGLFFARKLEEKFGLRSSQDSDLSAIEVVTTLLQFHTAGHLQNHLWGKVWNSWEARLAVQASTKFSAIPYSHAAQGDSSTHEGISRLAPGLLRALGLVPNYGSREHTLNVEVLDRLFKYDAASYSTGSFQNAIWQSFIQEALRDPVASQRDLALVAAFSALAKGPSRSDFLHLSKQFGYEKKWRVTEKNFFSGEIEIKRMATERPERYSHQEVSAALAAGRKSPFASLLLGRLHQILSEGDIPGKIRELFAEESTNTLAALTKLQANGLSRDVIAKRINGGPHVAYLDDIRVARKVITVYDEIAPYLRNPVLREANLKKLQQDFSDIWAKYPKLGTDAVLAFLGRQADPQARGLLRRIRQGNLELLMVSPNSFDDYVRENGVPENCSLSLFLKPRDTKQNSLIWLRAMPENLAFADPEAVFSEFSTRLVATFHEWEHYRHFHGDFDLREAKSLPFDIRRMGREDRLASETMAILEQLRWGIKHLDDDFYQVARQMGENLPQFARNMADWGYFGKAP